MVSLGDDTKKLVSVVGYSILRLKGVVERVVSFGVWQKLIYVDFTVTIFRITSCKK